MSVYADDQSSLEPRVAALEAQASALAALVGDNADSAAASIGAETALRVSADQAISALVQAEQTARIAGDQALADQIAALAQSVTLGDAINLDQVNLLAVKLTQALGEALAYSTWADAQAIDLDRTAPGRAVKIYGPDDGAHVDPVIGGAPVPNMGIYSVVAGIGLKRIANLEIADIAAAVSDGVAQLQSIAADAASSASAAAASATQASDLLSASFAYSGYSRSGFSWTLTGSNGELAMGQEAGGRQHVVIPNAVRSGAVTEARSDTGERGYSLSGFRQIEKFADGTLIRGVTSEAIPRAIDPEGITVSASAVKGYSLSGLSRIELDKLGRMQRAWGTTLRPVYGGAALDLAEGSALPSATGIAYTERDANGYLHLHHTGPGGHIKLTTRANNQLVALDPTRTKALIQSDRVQIWPTKGLFWVPLDGSRSAAPVFPKKVLLGVGDSIMAGAGASTYANSFFAKTVAALGATISANVNDAIGGQMLYGQIAQRFGALDIWLTIGGTSVTTSAVSVTASGSSSSNGKAIIHWTATGGNHYPDFRWGGSRSDTSGTTTRTYDGWVVDATGARKRARVTWATTSSTITCTVQSLTGATITVASTFQFVRDFYNATLGCDLRSASALIDGGTNDLGYGVSADDATVTPAEICANSRAMIAAIIAAATSYNGGSYAVVGLYNTQVSAQQAGTAGDLAIIEHNGILAGLYPFLNAFAIAQAAATSPGDDASVAKRWIPDSLTSDGTHPNDTLHNLLYLGNAGGTGAYALINAQLQF